MRRPQRRHPVADARRLDALGVPEERDDPRLVVGDPLRHDVAELLAHQRRVVGEALGGVARRPPAHRLAGARQVPVVERRHRLDPALEQTLDEPPVELDAAPVQLPPPVGLHPRPGDREAVRLEPQRRHQVEVAAPAVVVVARDLARVAAGHAARQRAEVVPDRRAAPALADGALDLVRRGRGPEPDHPFTAPAVSPRTSQRWVRKNASSTGSVETTPAAISCAYSCE